MIDYNKAIKLITLVYKSKPDLDANR